MKQPLFWDLKSGVYAIENLINGKRYIGSSNNIRRRWKEHKTHLRSGTHGNKHLQSSWNKYGPDNFKFIQLASCHSSNIMLIEQCYLKHELAEYNGTKVVRYSAIKHPRRSFTDQQVRQLRWLYDQKYSAVSIAKLFKVASGTIHSVISKTLYLDIEGSEACPELTKDLKLRYIATTRRVTPAQVRGLRQKCREGYSYTALSHMLSIGKESVRNIVNRDSYPEVTDIGKVDISWFKEKTSSEKGKKHIGHVLTYDQIHEIRALYDKKDMQVKDIAAQYKVHTRTISDIGLRKRYKKVPEKII